MEKKAELVEPHLLENAFEVWASGPSEWLKAIRNEPELNVIEFNGGKFSEYREGDVISFSEYHIPSDCKFNFVDVVFDSKKAVFSGVKLNGGNFEFKNVNFSKCEEVIFEGMTFAGDRVFIDNVDFESASVSFESSIFDCKEVVFFGCKFRRGLRFNSVKGVGAEIEFRNCSFFGDVLFSGSHFDHGKMSFLTCDMDMEREGSDNIRAKFNFKRVKLERCMLVVSECDFDMVDVDFSKTEFGRGGVIFDDNSFGESRLTFRFISSQGSFIFKGNDVQLVRSIDFSSSNFEGELSLSGLTTSSVVDFRHTKFDRSIDLDKIDIGYKKEDLYFCFSMAKNPDASTCFRKLKKLAKEAEDHRRALDFFAKEMKSDYWRGLTGGRLFAYYLYDVVSDYGRSIKRTLILFCVSFLIFGVIYSNMATEKTATQSAGFVYSFGHAIPIYPASRDARADAVISLFGSAENIPDETVI
ncbi:hypothetical protein O5O45_05650 [Hahella aquimaris]|uniref:hypothetical protein n=1 Tax=Hahella sp. HNIBRBA332 TaxID=3015983 RepID=UPI00273AAA2E|nr:hypothetical protein [Hahella sp. HNIBRBA332]WLQ15404.1 hypothetical protein O5O45_05650 [Hahella sp. HNIBRBA332]